MAACQSVATVGQAMVFSKQLNYSTVAILFQAKLDKLEKGVVRMYIFRAWITTKDGVKIYAKDYGKKAFRIWVGPGPEPAKKQ